VLFVVLMLSWETEKKEEEAGLWPVLRVEEPKNGRRRGREAHAGAVLLGVDTHIIFIQDGTSMARYGRPPQVKNDLGKLSLAQEVEEEEEEEERGGGRLCYNRFCCCCCCWCCCCCSF